jgi:alkylation response protein AidB-like acyl-CoA dehydrogenase
MEIRLETARATIRSHCLDVATGALPDMDVQTGIAKSAIAKYVAVNNAVAILDLAMEVAGGSGYYRRAPLERWFRDARAGTIHPVNNLDTEELVGKTALGIEVAPSIPLGESGLNSIPRPPLPALEAELPMRALSGWSV